MRLVEDGITLVDGRVDEDIDIAEPVVVNPSFDESAC